MRNTRCKSLGTDRAPTVIHTLERHAKLKKHEDRALRERLVASRSVVGSRRHGRSKQPLPVVDVADIDAVYTILRSWLGYMWRLACMQPGMAREQAYSAILQAFTRAIQRVDARPESSFGTVLLSEIRGALTNEYPYTTLIKLPSGAMTSRVIRRMGQARATLGLDPVAPLTEEETHAVAQYLLDLPGKDGKPFSANVSYKKTHVLVSLVDALRQGHVSLDAGLQGHEGDNEDAGVRFSLPDPAPNPEEVLSMKEDAENASILVQHGLRALSERERRVIQARTLSEDPRTLRSLAIELGLSPERVRQIEVEALRKVRQAIKLRAMAEKAA